MDNRQPDDYYTSVGRELIETEPELEYIRDSDVKIVFLSPDCAKKHDGGDVMGLCEKIQDKHKWSIPYDFMITVFEPNVEGKSDEQIRILLFHELLHVGIGQKNDGTETYYCRPHDLEDFRVIINRYGAYWDR